MNKQKTILIVEDEFIIGMDLQEILECKGYKVCNIISEGEEVLPNVEKYNPDLILMDITLKGNMSGFDATKELYKHYDTPIIYVSSEINQERLEKVKSPASYGYIIKPIKENELYTMIEISLNKYEMEKKLKESEKRYKKLIELVPVAINEVDTNGKIMLANKQFHELFGYDDNELIGSHIADLRKDKGQREKTAKYLNRVLKNRPQPSEYVDVLCRKDESEIKVSILWSYHVNEENEVIGFINVLSECKE
jgi:PAS domain S-box-containing protein